MNYETIKYILPNPDGSLWVAGTSYADSSPAYPFYFVAKVSAGGTLDTSFNGTGYLFFEHTPNSYIIIYPPPFLQIIDNKIIFTYNINEDNNIKFYIRRINSDGTIINTLNLNFHVDETMFDFTNEGLFITQFGKLYKFLWNGSTDSSFGNDGSVNLGYYPSLRKIDNHLHLVDERYDTNKFSLSVERRNLNGTLDTTFGNNGIAEITLMENISNPTQNYFREINIHKQSDGKVIVGGIMGVGSTYKLVLTRYLNP
ncbi:MAG: hypothetical protein NZ853_09440 [Leptospiraceae bacterium]|nr:hypothetical protein [Leptospiraceae bacterium]MDW7975653.1 hypothetical protein [Leptospiraceae bacterium]